MNESELKKLWETSNNKLEGVINLNKINSNEIAHLKVFHFISSMKLVKVFAILVGVAWVALGTIILSDLFLNAFSETSKFFLFSAAIQVGLTAIALVIYLYQLITIYQVDISDPVLRTQGKLASLKMSTLWVARILFLQLPVWTTFWWNDAMFKEWNAFQFLIAGGITLMFFVVAIWLFFNIKPENKDKKWFRVLFNGREWTPLIRSMDLLEQLDDYVADTKMETNE